MTDWVKINGNPLWTGSYVVNLSPIRISNGIYKTYFGSDDTWENRQRMFFKDIACFPDGVLKIAQVVEAWELE